MEGDGRITLIFDYPHKRTKRRHGPSGYRSYESYRPWLRDEFDFRCVYCLKRETWGHVTGEFELDHFAPQSISPERRIDYFNLVYACRRCNSVKLDQSVGDPLCLLHSEIVVVLSDGSLRTREVEPLRLILQLDLNSPRLKSWRVMWVRIVDLAKERDDELYHQLVAYPADVPDLAKLRPPSNSRKAGLAESCFARREFGKLPKVY
jgi:hypothetical protein